MELSELTPVPGNTSLDEGQKAVRVREIFRPYHDRIEAELNQRAQAGLPAALVAMHSFTPSFMGVARPWHAGVLYIAVRASRISSGSFCNVNVNSWSETMSLTA